MVFWLIGGGIGFLGNWGCWFSFNIFLANIFIDSWYVMIWVELGIVGFLLYFGVLFYILGKACYLVMFKIRDDWICGIIMVMACGMFGVMVVFYGNGVLG